ncbi:MAG: molybdenum ABC transporter ATP-binding protein [Chloroflexota bacterium]|nr:molybdenum ABC transporter ATP-binding protein [Chloroflexota bacterium]
MTNQPDTRQDTSRLSSGWISYRVGQFSLAAQWEVEAGQLLTLFGPSGAGKTTLLRAIAGLVRPQEGSIRIGDRMVFDSASGLFVPPHRRRVGFLTQGHHLFPHLTVAGNIAYGLARATPDGRRVRVAELVEMFQLNGLEHRRPGEISGGQQQRAALARALAPSPELMLLDEPFSSLDIELRRTLRSELREKLRDAAIPAILVTHDIEEAISMADQVQIIDNGQVSAAGNPLQMLGQPGQGRVARLVGVENLIPMVVTSVQPQDGTMVCARQDGGSPPLEVPLSDVVQGDQVTVGIRASDIILADSEPRGSSARNRLPGVVSDVRLRPPGYQVTLDCGGLDLSCHITGTSLNEMGIRSGDSLWAVFKASSCFLVRD